MKPLPLLSWAGCCLVLLGAAGCNKGPAKPRVAFITNNPESFWTIAEAGAKKAASETGVELIFRKPSPGNAATQREEIESALNRGVKAIAVSVLDPKTQSEYLDEVAAKVPLICQDNDAPKTKRLAYIGTDNYAAGRAAGKLVKEALGKEGGTVVIFVGTLESLNARQRRQGVIDEIADRKAPADTTNFENTPDGEKYGNFQLYSKTYLDQPEGGKRAKENAEDALEKIPADANVCMVGLYAYNPPMILSAVSDLKDEARRKRIKIVGFDEDAATLAGIKAGTVYATVVQDPYGFGYEAVTMMAALARGDKSGLPKDGIKYIPYRVIAKEAGEVNGEKRLGVEAFSKELDRLLGK
jgi:ribose transport system substrate-binding protein